MLWSSSAAQKTHAPCARAAADHSGARGAAKRVEGEAAKVAAASILSSMHAPQLSLCGLQMSLSHSYCTADVSWSSSTS
eukprot:4018214-Pleurochrysis_carterae.AAC.1